MVTCVALAGMSLALMLIFSTLFFLSRVTGNGFFREYPFREQESMLE